MSQSVINQPFLFTDMSRTDNNKGISASQPTRPSWAVSLDNKDAWDLMNVDIPSPLPQRKSHRKQQLQVPSDHNYTNNNDPRTSAQDTLGPVNSVNTNSNATTVANNNIITTANSMVTDNITTTSTNTPITTSNINTGAPATSYGSSLSSIITYKNYLILSLLSGQQGRAAPPNTSHPTAQQLVPSGSVSPVDQLNIKLQQFRESLKTPIHNLCNIAVTINNIGTLVNNGKIPWGCIPTCGLGVQNPLLALTQSWNQCLLECGKQITAILIDHYSNSHEALLTEIKNNINTEFQSLSNEFGTTVAELQSKLKFTEQIFKQIQLKESEMLNRKRESTSNQDQPTKKQKTTDNNPDFSEQVITALTRVPWSNE